MNPFEEILLPVDFSPVCVEVGRYAVALAGHFHSRITLLHVVLPFNPAWAAFGACPGLDEIYAHDREQARYRLNVFLEEELQNFEVNRVLMEGDPADAITCLAQRDKPGLIMMPTLGCGRFRRFVLGSITTKVLHDVPSPVWTSAHIINGAAPASDSPKVIVCAAI
jgi:nucleotide-binding universal stress UspA family protein